MHSPYIFRSVSMVTHGKLHLHLHPASPYPPPLSTNLRFAAGSPIMSYTFGDAAALTNGTLSIKDQIPGDGNNQVHRVYVGEVELEPTGGGASLDMGTGSIVFPAKVETDVTYSYQSTDYTISADGDALFAFDNGVPGWDAAYPINVILDYNGSSTQRSVYIEIDTGDDWTSNADLNVVLAPYDGVNLVIDFAEVSGVTTGPTWNLLARVDLSIAAPSENIPANLINTETGEDEYSSQVLVLEGDATARGSGGVLDLYQWVVTNPSSSLAGKVVEPDADGYTDQNCFRLAFSTATDGQNTYTVAKLQMFDTDAEALETHISALASAGSYGMAGKITLRVVVYDVFDGSRQDTETVTLYFAPQATTDWDTSYLMLSTGGTGNEPTAPGNKMYWMQDGNTSTPYGTISNWRTQASAVTNVVGDYLSGAADAFAIPADGLKHTGDFTNTSGVISLDGDTSGIPASGTALWYDLDTAAWVSDTYTNSEGTITINATTVANNHVPAVFFTAVGQNHHAKRTTTYVLHAHGQGDISGSAVLVSDTNTVAVGGTVAAATVVHELPHTDLPGDFAVSTLVSNSTINGMTLTGTEATPTGANGTAFNYLQSVTGVWFSIAAGQTSTVTDGSAQTLSGHAIRITACGRIQDINFPTAGDAITFHVVDAPEVSMTHALTSDQDGADYYAPVPVYDINADGFEYITGVGLAAGGTAYLSSLADVTDGPVDNTSSLGPYSFDVTSNTGAVSLLALDSQNGYSYDREVFGDKGARVIRANASVSETGVMTSRAIWGPVLGIYGEFSTDNPYEAVVHVNVDGDIIPSMQLALTMVRHGTTETYAFNNSAGTDDEVGPVFAYYLGANTTAADYITDLVSHLDAIDGITATAFGSRIHVRTEYPMGTFAFAAPSAYSSQVPLSTDMNWMIGGVRAWVVKRPAFEALVTIPGDLDAETTPVHVYTDSIAASEYAPSGVDLRVVTLTVPGINRPMQLVRTETGSSALIAWSGLGDGDVTGEFPLDGNNHVITFIIPTSHSLSPATFTPLAAPKNGVSPSTQDVLLANTTDVTAWYTDVHLTDVSTEATAPFGVGEMVDATTVQDTALTANGVAPADDQYITTVDVNNANRADYVIHFTQIGQPTYAVTDGTDAYTAGDRLAFVHTKNPEEPTELFRVEPSGMNGAVVDAPYLPNTLKVLMRSAAHGLTAGQDLIDLGYLDSDWDSEANVWIVTVGSQADTSWFNGATREAVTLLVAVHFNSGALNGSAIVENSGTVDQFNLILQITEEQATTVNPLLISPTGGATESEANAYAYDSTYAYADNVDSPAGLLHVASVFHENSANFTTDVSIDDTTNWAIQVATGNGTDVPDTPTAASGGSVTGQVADITVHLYIKSGRQTNTAISFPTLTFSESPTNAVANTFTSEHTVGPTDFVGTGTVYRYFAPELSSMQIAESGNTIYQKGLAYDHYGIYEGGNFYFTATMKYGLGDASVVVAGSASGGGPNGAVASAITVTPGAYTGSGSPTDATVAGPLFDLSGITYDTTHGFSQARITFENMHIYVQDPVASQNAKVSYAWPGNNDDQVQPPLTDLNDTYTVFKALTTDADGATAYVAQGGSENLPLATAYADGLIAGGLFMQNLLDNNLFTLALTGGNSGTDSAYVSSQDIILHSRALEVSNSLETVTLTLSDGAGGLDTVGGGAGAGVADTADLDFTLVLYQVPTFTLLNQVQEVREINESNNTITVPLTVTGGVSGSSSDTPDYTNIQAYAAQLDFTKDGSSIDSVSVNSLARANESSNVTATINLGAGAAHGSVIKITLTAKGYTAQENRYAPSGGAYVKSTSGSPIQLWAAQADGALASQFLHLVDTELVEAWTAETTNQDLTDSNFLTADLPGSDWSATFSFAEALRRDIWFRGEGLTHTTASFSNWRFPYQQYVVDGSLTLPISNSAPTTRARRAQDIVTGSVAGIISQADDVISVRSVVGFYAGQTVYYNGGTLDVVAATAGTIVFDADHSLSVGDLLYVESTTAKGRPIPVITVPTTSSITVHDTTGIEAGGTYDGKTVLSVTRPTIKIESTATVDDATGLSAGTILYSETGQAGTAYTITAVDGTTLTFSSLPTDGTVYTAADDARVLSSSTPVLVVDFTATVDDATGLTASDVLYTGTGSTGTGYTITEVDGTTLTFSTLPPLGTLYTAADSPRVLSGRTSVTALVGSTSAIVNHNEGNIAQPVYDIGDLHDSSETPDLTSFAVPASTLDFDTVHYTVLDHWSLPPLNAPLPENFMFEVVQADKTTLVSDATFVVHGTNPGGDPEDTTVAGVGQLFVGPDWDEVSGSANVAAWSNDYSISLSCSSSGTYYLVMRPLGYDSGITSDFNGKYYAMMPFTILGTPQVYGYIDSGETPVGQNAYSAITDASRSHVDNMAVQFSLDDFIVKLTDDGSRITTTLDDFYYLVRLEGAYGVTTYGDPITVARPTDTSAWVDLTDMLETTSRALPGAPGTFTFTSANANSGGDGVPFLVINPTDVGQSLITIAGLAERWHKPSDTYLSTLEDTDIIANEAADATIGRMIYRLRVRAYASQPGAPFTAAGNPFTDIYWYSTRATDNDGTDGDQDYTRDGINITGIHTDSGNGPFNRTILNMTQGYTAQSTLIAPVAYTAADNGIASRLMGSFQDENVYSQMAPAASTLRHTMAEPRNDVRIKAQSARYYGLLTSADVSLDHSNLLNNTAPHSAQYSSLEAVSNALGDNNHNSADGVAIFNGRIVRARRQWLQVATASNVYRGSSHNGTVATSDSQWLVGESHFQLQDVFPNIEWFNVGQDSAWITFAGAATGSLTIGGNWSISDNDNVYVIGEYNSLAFLRSCVADGAASGTELNFNGGNITDDSNGAETVFSTGSDTITTVGGLGVLTSFGTQNAATSITFTGTGDYSSVSYAILTSGGNATVVTVDSTSTTNGSTTFNISGTPDLTDYTDGRVIPASGTAPTLGNIQDATTVTLTVTITDSYAESVSYTLGSTAVTAYNPGPFTVLVQTSAAMPEIDVGTYMLLGSAASGSVKCVLVARSGNYAILRALAAVPSSFTGTVYLYASRIWTNEDIDVPVSEHFAYRSAWRVNGSGVHSSQWRKIAGSVSATDSRQVQVDTAMTDDEQAVVHPGAFVYFASSTTATNEIDDISSIFVVEELVDAQTVNLDRDLPPEVSDSNQSSMYVLHGYVPTTTLGAGISVGSGMEPSVSATITQSGNFSITDNDVLYFVNGGEIYTAVADADSSTTSATADNVSHLNAGTYSSGTFFTIDSANALSLVNAPNGIDVSALGAGVTEIVVANDITTYASVTHLLLATGSNVAVIAATFSQDGTDTTLTIAETDLTSYSYVFGLSAALGAAPGNTLDMSATNITVAITASLTGLPVWTGAHADGSKTTADLFNAFVPTASPSTASEDTASVSTWTSGSSVLYYANPFLYRTFQQFIELALDYSFYSGAGNVNSGSIPTAEQDIIFDNVNATYIRLVDASLDDPTAHEATRALTLSKGGNQYVEEPGIRQTINLQARPALTGLIA